MNINLNLNLNYTIDYSTYFLKILLTVFIDILLQSNSESRIIKQKSLEHLVATTNSRLVFETKAT